MSSCKKGARLEEVKQWVRTHGIGKDELVERLHAAETALAKFQSMAALPALERHRLAELFRDRLTAYAGGASLRQTANDIVDVFIVELIKRAEDEESHCGGYGCMCGTD